MSKIVPRFQKCDPPNPENYRPIANLNHLGKIYEKLILKRVWAMVGDSHIRFKNTVLTGSNSGGSWITKKIRYFRSYGFSVVWSFC